MINREKLYSIYSLVFSIFYSKKFKNFGSNSKIIFPLKISNKTNISIGNDVRVGFNCSLSAENFTNEKDILLTISDGVCLGNFNHIVCSKKITFQKNVLTSDKVYISDNLHEYNDISLPIIKQPIKQLNAVVIGEGSWIGENVCIIGASIGKNSVIGANSVVTKNIPDYSIAIGAPAKVIKTYNFDIKKWEKIK